MDGWQFFYDANRNQVIMIDDYGYNIINDLLENGYCYAEYKENGGIRKEYNIMENHFPFHKFSPIENMLSNIIAEGQKEVWDSIEEEKNGLKRASQRKLYFEALKKLERNK